MVEPVTRLIESSNKTKGKTMLEQLKKTLDYIKKTPIYRMDLDILLDVIEQYNALNIDPNEECPFEAALVGDIEVAYDNAEHAQIDEE